MKIIKGTKEHLPELSLLFNQYRIFYKQKSNVNAAKEFLSERIKNNESTLFIAYVNNIAVGFTQLYPSFSSVSLKPILILNDLYVLNKNRGIGIGEALLNKAKTYCKENNYIGLALETDIQNPAQKLYEKLEWEKDVHCFHYFWSVN